VVLPERLHCAIELPLDAEDFATLWRYIKLNSSKALLKNERLWAARSRRGERGIVHGVFGGIEFATLQIRKRTSITCISIR
jgi:hypothetical protein